MHTTGYRADSINLLPTIRLPSKSFPGAGKLVTFWRYRGIDRGVIGIPLFRYQPQQPYTLLRREAGYQGKDVVGCHWRGHGPILPALRGGNDLRERYGRAG